MIAIATKSISSLKTIISFGILSKILNFIKETLMAAKIGCQFDTDIYFIAFTATTFLAEIIGQGISTSMVPILLKIETQEGKKRKVDFVNNILHIVILFSIILMILGWFLSPVIIKILAKDFKGEKFKLAVKFMKIGLPIILFIGIRSIFVAFLQSNHGFKAGAKSWVYYNIVYIIFLVFFSKYKIPGLMISGVLASASQLLSIIPTSKNMGYKYERKLDFKDTYLKEIFLMLIPIVIGLTINEINIIIDETIASSLSTGSISELNFANDIIQLIFGLFITAIITVLFPIISEQYNKENMDSFKNVVIKGMNLILKIAIPASLLLIVLSKPLVKLLFQRKAFDQNAAYMTSQALIYYALGLAGMSLNLMLTKAHYAIHDTITPMKYGFITAILNLALNVILSKYMGHRGIALATSISITIGTILLIKNLNNVLQILNIQKFIKNLIKLLIAATIMALVVFLIFNILKNILKNNTLTNVLGLLISSVAGIAIYLSMCSKMNIYKLPLK